MCFPIINPLGGNSEKISFVKSKKQYALGERYGQIPALQVKLSSLYGPGWWIVRKNIAEIH